MQYKVGTVSATSGSQTVTGSGTSWLANLSGGDQILIDGDAFAYKIASVDSDTQLTLTENYYQTVAGVEYVAVTDFTPNLALPKLNQGDLHGADIFTLAIEMLDAAYGIPSVPADNLLSLEGTDGDTGWIYDSSNTRIKGMLNDVEKVRIFGEGLRIKPDVSGATPNGSGDELIVESAGTGGISVLTPNGTTAFVMFGSPGGGGANGRIAYLHSAPRMELWAGNARGLSIGSNGQFNAGPYDPAAYCRVGGNTTSHALSSPADLFISGKAEIDGAAYFDGIAYFSNDVREDSGSLTYEHRRVYRTGATTAAATVIGSALPLNGGTGTYFMRLDYVLDGTGAKAAGSRLYRFDGDATSLSTPINNEVKTGTEYCELYVSGPDVVVRASCGSASFGHCTAVVTMIRAEDI